MTSPLTELGALATALGGVSFVQGAGGNISVKDANQLWIKASGTRLATTADAPGHVVVPLADALGAHDGDAAADARLFAHRPRPSMETYFHALPGRVVAHTHPVGVALLACSNRPVSKGFLDIPIVDVPYVRPGRGLAVAMRTLRPDAPAVAFLLRNHGLVISAPNVAIALDATRRLDAACRDLLHSKDDFESTVRAALSVASSEASPRHRLRTLTDRPRAGRAPRYLFPDAVVYAAVRRVETASLDAARMLISLHPQWFSTNALLEDDLGRRVLLAPSDEELNRATEIVTAHDWVDRTLTEAGGAQYLDDAEPAALLALPAEKYRQQLAGKP